VEVLDLPRRNEEEEAESGKGGGTRLEDIEALVTRGLITADGERIETLARSGVGCKHEGHETHSAHANTIDKLIANQIKSEDTRLETARRALENIRLSLLKTKTESQRGRGDQVGPENLDGREREHGMIIAVLESQANQEEDDLSQVGGQKMEQELDKILVSR
jgi:hypothetical protein